MMIENVRSEIAVIDRQIVDLITKRTRLASEILKAKRAAGVKHINDEKQNKNVLNRVVDMATERNIDAGSVKKIFEILIAMNQDIQHELSGEGNLP
ncbi:MAG TPA: chorismate mutase [Candidatus Acidoferrales bacterium]|nr:chorismate mutase [Candidatus Acidoferrales bacterium]